VALLPCGAMLVGVVLTTVLTYGNVRFRIQVDVVLPMLAAVPVLALVDRVRARPGLGRRHVPVVRRGAGSLDRLSLLRRKVG